MKKRTAIILGVLVAFGAVIALALVYDERPAGLDDSSTSPLEGQAAARRAHARYLQDSMRDQGAGRITIDTTDYGDVTLRLGLSQCSTKFVSDFTAAPSVKRRLKELRFEAVMCAGGSKMYSIDW